jgi:hypothetical protein
MKGEGVEIKTTEIGTSNVQYTASAFMGKVTSPSAIPDI